MERLSFFDVCGYRDILDHDKKFVNGKVYINGIERFWSFANERLIRYFSILLYQSVLKSFFITLKKWNEDA